MSQTETALQVLDDVTNKLAQAATETDILKAIEVYLSPQCPRLLGLCYLDTLPQPDDIVLVASRLYGEADAEHPLLNQRWSLADYTLTDVFRTDPKNALLIEDTAHDPHIRDDPKLAEATQRYRIGSLAIIPLYCAEQWHGAIVLTWTEPRKFSDADKVIYQTIARTAAASASSRRNFLIAERLRQRTETISRTYSQMAQTKSFYDVYERLSELAEKFGAEVKLLIRNNQHGELRILDSATSLTEKPLDQGSLNVSAILTKAIQQVWWIENVEESSSPLTAYLRGLGVQAYACLPFHVPGQWLGSFVAGWRVPHHFDVELGAILEAVVPTASTMLANHSLLEQLQKRMQFSDSYLNAILNYAPIEIFTLDVGGNITYTNGKLAPRFGGTPREAIGRSWVEVFSESRESLEKVVQRAVKGDQFSDVLTIRGRQLWQQSAPLRDTDGSLIGSVGITQDITQFVEAQTQLRALSRQLIEAEEKERSNLARELHDEVGQSLTAILYQLNKLERLSPGLDTETVVQIQTIVKGLIVQMRELSHSLHPPVLDTYGLSEALRWYCSQFTGPTQIKVDLKITGKPQRLPPEIELTGYRVVQEALTNIARYARTDRAVVKVSITARRVKITVEDSGIGFDVEAVQASHATYGLAAMRERVSMLKGKLSITSRPNAGTVLCAEIPLTGI